MSVRTETADLHQTKRGLRSAFWVGRVLIYVVLVFFGVLYMAPFAWMLSTSVKPGFEVFVIPPQWIPSKFEWDNYWQPWSALPFATFYWNTIKMTVFDILATLASCSAVAFGFARMRFRGRDFLFLVVLATMMLPGQVTLIPVYVLWSRLGLVNTLWPLMIPYLFASPFNVFLLRQYMMTIPIEYDDAARIDGASWFQIYSRVILPMSAPVLGVIAIFSFTFHWNDFLGPLIYLNEEQNFVISLGLQLLNSRYSIAIQQTMAQTIIAIIPVLVVFFVAQKYYIQGIVITGVKG